jgi:hypothetical protein
MFPHTHHEEGGVTLEGRGLSEGEPAHFACNFVCGALSIGLRRHPNRSILLAEGSATVLRRTSY